MSTTSYYDKLAATMPPGLDRSIVMVLKFHVGKERAIKKPEIMKNLKALGVDVHERQFRDMVADMRLKGWMIGSLSADGYYFCATKQEYDEFRAELEARRKAIAATLHALDAAARQRWGDGTQVGLL